MRAFLIAACIVLASSYACAADADAIEKVEAPYYAHFADVMPKCMEESGFPVGDMKAMHKQLLESEDKHKVGCVKYCLLEKKGMAQDGKPNVDKLKEMIATVHKEHPEMKGKLEAGLDECNEETKTTADKCDRIEKFSSCFRAKHHMETVR